MKSLPYYDAAVADLEVALGLLEAVNRHFPQYRVPTRDLKKQIKAITAARDKKEAREYAA